MDLEILASFHGIEKPEFFSKPQDVMSEMWLGNEMFQLIEDTQVLGGFSL